MYYSESYYRNRLFRGKSLLFWAEQWFSMSNDMFYKMYGFNFNPHDFPGLYEIARKVIYSR